MTPPDETLADDTQDESTRLQGPRRIGRAAASALRPGELLSERYEILRLLGRGGMGEVYEALDRELGLRVAVKTLSSALVHDSRGLKLLKREVLLARQVSHPNVCRLHDLGRDDSRSLLFATMELLPGQTLGEWAASRQPLDVETALLLVRQLAEGLEAAHAAGVVHRDIKPANVIVVAGEQPASLRAVLTDFGIAKWRTLGQSEAGEPEEVTGTPAYMAPEQLRGDPVGPAADVYALGVVLFEMMTGSRPFSGEDAWGGAFQKLEKDAPSPAERRSDLPEAWTNTIRRCLARAPEERPARAARVVALLEGRAERPGGPGHLPAARDAFVGRGRELEELGRRLEAGARLVTVLGPGGTGKTRLATRFAGSRLEAHPGGVWFCDLSEARDLEQLVRTVAVTLDVPLAEGDPVVRLGHAIAARGRCLLLLDNFEQLVEHGGEAVGAWLDRAPDARFLVTSRSTLGLPGEDVLPVEPLPLDGEALELFELRARARKPSFAIDEGNRDDVREVVRLLDGLPLAIELAAARISVFSPAQLVQRMSDRFRLLAGARGASKRQETLRAAIDWSWDLLSPWERATFAQCSAFVGGFTLAAAEEVLDLGAFEDAPWAVDAVQALVDKSLLRSWSPRDAEPRHAIDEPWFGMYVSLQEYAAEKLRTRDAIAPGCGGPETELATFVRHGRFHSRPGTQKALDALHSAEGTDRRRAIALDLDNVVTACRRALARGDGATAVDGYLAASAVFSWRGPVALAVELGEQVGRSEGLTLGQQARVALCHGDALSQGRDLAGATARVEQALELARADGDSVLEGRALCSLGQLDLAAGRTAEAEERLVEALRLLRSAGSRIGEADALRALGAAVRWRSRLDEARGHLEASVAIFRELGDRPSEGEVLTNLGLLKQELVQHADSQRDLLAALAIHRECGNRRWEARCLMSLPREVEAEAGIEGALTPREAALEIYREIGDRAAEARLLGQLGAVLRDEGRITEATAHAEASRAIAAELGQRPLEAAVLNVLGLLRASSGEAEEGRRLLEESLAIQREAGFPLGQGNTLRALAMLAAEAGELERAEALIREARELASGLVDLQGHVAATHANILSLAGRPREALAEVERALAAEHHPITAGLLHAARAFTQLSAGDVEAARDSLETGEALAREGDAPPGSDTALRLAEVRRRLEADGGSGR